MVESYGDVEEAVFFVQAEDGIRDLVRSRGLGDVYKRQSLLPLGLQKLSCAVMFAIELVLPFLIALGLRARLVAFAGFVALQLGIGLTGNYGFFNFLTIVLCIPLLDLSLIHL